MLWEQTFYNLYSLKFVKVFLWPRMSFILVNVPCAWKKNVYSAVGGWSILWVWNRSSWLIVLFRSWILLIFFFLDLSTTNRGMLMSLAVIVDSSDIFSVLSFCLVFFDTHLLEEYIFRIDMSSWRMTHSLLSNVPLSPW